MISPDLLTRCHDMALALARELRQRPLYVIDVSDLGDLAPRSSSCLGWADISPVENAAIAARLGDRWQGAGPTIALDGAAIREQVRPEQFDRFVLGVALHETAHILPSPTTFVSRAPSFVAATMDAYRFHKSLTAPDLDPTVDANHDSRFVRRAMHLYVRALLQGFDVPSDFLMAQHTRPDHYLSIALKEAVEMRDATFAEIEATDPPRDFLRQWESDIEFYNRIRNRS